MKEEEGLYYPCSKNKGADQLHGYCEADLRFCFRICRLLVSLCSGCIMRETCGREKDFMHQSFVTTAPPPTGKGWDYGFSAFSALL